MKPMLVIVGKSGSGKNFIPELFGLNYTPGHTTRPPRVTDNPNLRFKKKENYFTEKKKGITCAATYYNGNYYWSHISDVNDEKNDFLICSPEGLQDLLEVKKKSEMSVDHFIKLQTNIKNKNLIKPTPTLLIRPLQIVYFDTPLLKRVWNMRKRGDRWGDIWKRIKNDRRDFATVEKTIKKEHLGIIVRF